MHCANGGACVFSAPCEWYDDRDVLQAGIFMMVCRETRVLFG